VLATAESKWSKRRRNRRLRGLCGYSGCKVKTGDAYYCEEHRRRHADAQKERRNGGLCAGCTVDTGDGAYRCLTHAKEHAAAQKLLRAKRKAP